MKISLTVKDLTVMIMPITEVIITSQTFQMTSKPSKTLHASILGVFEAHVLNSNGSLPKLSQVM